MSVTISTYGEGPVLHVGLDSGVGELPSNQPLGVKDGVVRVHGHLVLGGISNETLGVRKGHIGRGGTVSLVVGDDLNLENGWERVKD